ncbi:MAG: hypothetical protein HYU36_01130 [Planctomycetes bacterium]|nr:hypothetical protein [Planctomycetota bacterium]
MRFSLRLSSTRSGITTGFFVGLAAGSSRRTLWPCQFLEPDRYGWFDLVVDHVEAGPMTVSVTWGQMGEFFEKAFGKEVASEVRTDESKVDLTAAAAGGDGDAGLGVDEGDEALKEIRGGGSLEDLAGPYLALDRVDLRALQHIGRIVSIEPSKVRYEPGEEGRALIRVRGYGQPAGKPDSEVPKARNAPLQLIVGLVQELDERVTVWEGPIELSGSSLVEKEVRFPVGGAHFGRALVAEILDGGRVVDVGEEPFGVASQAYEICIWGHHGPGMNDSSDQAILDEMVLPFRRSYANMVEMFAWAPCDFWEASPETETWYSGQNSVPYSKKGIRRLNELCHERGIQSVAYYATCARVPAGLEPLLAHPEWFFQGVAGVGFIRETDVDAMERMVRGEYEGPKGRLSSYQIIPVNCNFEEVVRHGGEELVRSARMFGWDGVRYDGHFVGGTDARTVRNDQRVRSIVRKELPSYQFGYNAGMSIGYWAKNLRTDRYTRTDMLNFVQICSDGGLLMNESFRGYSNRNYSAAVIEDYLLGANVEARATRRAGGYHLGFFFDKCTPSDQTYNAAILLASGSRPYGFSWNGGLAQEWPRFVTRYSAYYWDNELFEILDAKERIEVRSASTVWYERTCYRRPRLAGRGQYILHLIAKPRHEAFHEGVQQPAPVLEDVHISLRPDEGWKVTSAWALTPGDPEMTGLIPLRAEGERVEVTLPKLTVFASVVLNAEGPAGQEMRVQRLPDSGEADPVKACWLKAEALRKQGYLAEAKPEEREKELEGLRQLGLPTEVQMKLAGAATGVSTAAPVFRQTPVRADAAPPEGVDRPADLKLRRNRILDVRLARGVFNWLLRLDEALGRAGGAQVSSGFIKSYSWGDFPGKLTDTPWTYEDLHATDVVVLNNAGPAHLDGPSAYRLRDFVEQGGGLLVLGGYWTLSKGGFRESWLEDVLPVDLYAGDPTEEIRREGMPHPEGQGLVLKPGPRAPPAVARLPWGATPSLRYRHQVRPKEKAEVWALAGEHPVLLAGQFGRGRVLVWAGAVHGVFGPDETPFWEWHGWPALLAEGLSWLGQGYRDFYQPQPDQITEDDVVEALNASRGEEQGPEEARRRLADLVHRADPPAAAYLLTAHGDEVDLADEMILQLVERIEPGTTGLIPAARRFLETGQPPLLAAGVRLIGLSREKSLEDEVMGYLDSKFIEVQTGAALALSDIGSPRSLPALVKKSEELEGAGLDAEEARLLYHRVLVARHRLGDPAATGKLAQASLHTYNLMEESWREWAYRVGKLTAGGFRLTPRERAGAEAHIRRLKDAHARWRTEFGRLAGELSHLKPETAAELAAALMATEEHPALGLVHRISEAASVETLRGLMPLLGSKMPALGFAVARRAAAEPRLQDALAEQLARLARSPQTHQRRFVALAADFLPEDARGTILPLLADDPDTGVKTAARGAQAALMK